MTCRSESTFTPFGMVQFCGSLPFYMLMCSHDHLRNALSGIDLYSIRGQIDHNDPYLSAVIGIYGSGTVQDPDPLFDSQTATRSDLCLIPGRKFNIQSGRYQSPFERLQRNTVGNICPQVHPCRQGRCVIRQGIRGTVDDLDFHKCKNKKKTLP